MGRLHESLILYLTVLLIICMFNVSYSQEGSSLVSNLGNVDGLAPNNAGMTQKLLYLASLLS